MAHLCDGLCDSVGLDWSLRICSSYKFPGYADAAATGTTTL